MIAEPLDQRLLMRGGDPDLVGRELLHYIAAGIEHAPRSQQVLIGPSEIGNPCRRRIAYKLLDTPGVRVLAPNWKATVGTGAHLWLADTFGVIEADVGVERFYVETELVIAELGGELIKGTCDLYDRMTATVVDWKTTSAPKLLDYKRHGPGAQYRAQAHLYGLGWRRLGLPVDQVMIVFLPRNGELCDTYVWYERFDVELARAALDRLAGIKQLVDTFGTSSLAMLPTTEAYCLHCPFLIFDSPDLVKGCPGDPAMLQPTRAAAIEMEK